MWKVSLFRVHNNKERGTILASPKNCLERNIKKFAHQKAAPVTLNLAPKKENPELVFREANNVDGCKGWGRKNWFNFKNTDEGLFFSLKYDLIDTYQSD